LSFFFVGHRLVCRGDENENMNGSPIYMRVMGGAQSLGGWGLMAPGLLLIGVALAIILWPELLAYLVAGVLLMAGISLTAWGWSMRRLARRQSRSAVYYEVR
jgi:hypothetical protein